MSWRNVAKTLEMQMSTVIDACSEIRPQRQPPSHPMAIVKLPRPAPASRFIVQ
jgi:hypothetical protein